LGKKILKRPLFQGTKEQVGKERKKTLQARREDTPRGGEGEAKKRW